MAHLFKKHYTRDEARELLPQVKEWLDELEALRRKVRAEDHDLSVSLGLGDDLGGKSVNRYIRTLADIKEVLVKFRTREIQIKDLDRGLVDFPAFRAGQEVFLCWEKGEDDIEYWHDLTSGYAGREKL